MARGSKGPRRPKIRSSVTVVRAPVRPNVVHHVHHLGPSMTAVRRRTAMAPPVLARPIAPAVRPVAPVRPLPTMPLARPMAPVGVPPAMGGVGRPPGPFTVPQPAVGAPRAPLMGPGGGPIGRFGRRPFGG